MAMKREDKSSPLYMISVVSKILEVHPQTLKMYEREGFVNPHRTNKQRIYSDKDVERLGVVVRLTKELGVNKAGVDIILRMKDRINALQDEMHEVIQLLEDDIRPDFEKRLQRILKGDLNETGKINCKEPRGLSGGTEACRKKGKPATGCRASSVCTS
ncbi:MerR family transcriptional regulator [Thermodesulfovibrionales bacterium]|nr:MerR family transcriptional regulator [Thermodesulfovibrionales bacterium]